MEQLKNMKETLIAQVQTQLSNIQQADAKELGEAIDMIKDLSEAIYYCTIVKSMEDTEDSRNMPTNNNNYYYTERYYDYPQENTMYYPRRHYTEGNSSSSRNMGTSSSGMSHFHEYDYPSNMRDYREGRSPVSRRMYMEAKETNQNSSKKIQELEVYLKELTEDIMDMISDASPEEKSVLQKKMNTLSAKLQNV